MKFLLVNAFSLNMCCVRRGYDVALRPITPQAARNLVINENAKSAIGHPDTARVVASLLGLEDRADEWARIASTRPSVEFDGASLIVAQYSGPRLPPGATELPEGAKIEFWQVYEVGQ
jgi:hypothetical protein